MHYELRIMHYELCIMNYKFPLRHCVNRVAG